MRVRESPYVLSRVSKMLSERCFRLTIALSRAFKENRRALNSSSHAPLLQTIHGTVSLARLKLLTTSDLPGRKPLVLVALPDSQFIHLFFCVLFNGEVLSTNLEPVPVAAATARLRLSGNRLNGISSHDVRVAHDPV